MAAGIVGLEARVSGLEETIVGLEERIGGPLSMIEQRLDTKVDKVLQWPEIQCFGGSSTPGGLSSSSLEALLERQVARRGGGFSGGP